MFALPTAASAGGKCRTVGAKDRYGQVCRPNPGGTPTWGPKYKVILYGDSLAFETTPYLGPALTGSKRATFVNRSFPGTAVCDWLPKIARDASPTPPDAVIVTTYGNNISKCGYRGGVKLRTDSAGYWQMYRESIDSALAKFDSRTLVILAAVPAAKPDLASGPSHKARMLQLMRDAATGLSNVSVIDAGSAVELPGGGYTRSLRCLTDEPCANRPTPGYNLVRALDGLHFCPPIYWAHVSTLRNCSVYASGARRFGLALAKPVVEAFGL
jgi:hypothetical protein